MTTSVDNTMIREQLRQWLIRICPLLYLFFHTAHFLPCFAYYDRLGLNTGRRTLYPQELDRSESDYPQYAPKGICNLAC